MATIDDGIWHCMTDAPRDGTEVELLVRHTNFRFCKTDEERSMWEQALPAKWIDFNGGGWTWRGIAGSAVGWRPLPAKQKQETYAGLLRGKARENDALDEAKAEKKCNFGVGCGTSGICYAKANGNPDMCGARSESRTNVPYTPETP